MLTVTNQLSTVNACPALNARPRIDWRLIIIIAKSNVRLKMSAKIFISYLF